MDFPLVKRSTYEKLKAKLAQAQNRLGYKEAEIIKLKSDLTCSKRLAKEVLPKLVRVHEPFFDNEHESYRACVDIARDQVQRAFIHGNSDREIEFFADLLSETIKRKLFEFNFFRRR